ncbi:MAG: tetratricopeptide repeat protein [Spirochaetes bacterium]|nr:tetratricopeptide repeat protein [Spirochaetota bacterium]
MKKSAIAIVAAGIILLPAAAMSQQGAEKAAQPSLDRIADDLKFQNGMQLLRLRQNQKALEVLGEYLEIFNDGVHRNEAYRSIAEIHFNRYDYQKAIGTYRRLFEEFSTTDDGVDAYFQVGICYSKMGYDRKAQEVFQEIVDDYPDSGSAGQARTQLELLNVMQQ